MVFKRSDSKLTISYYLKYLVHTQNHNAYILCFSIMICLYRKTNADYYHVKATADLVIFFFLNVQTH